MGRLLIISCFLGLLSGRAAAQGDGGYAGAFLRMGLGARAVGLGNAFVALADDAYAGFYNPAGLPSLDRRQIALSHSFLSLDRTVNFVGYAQSLPPSAGLSLGWLRAGTDRIDGRDFSGEHFGFLSETMNAFMFSFAVGLHPRIAAGLTLKLLEHRLPDAKATDIAFDFGVILEVTEALRLGAQLKDYQGGFTWDTREVYERGSTTVDEIPVTGRVGASLGIASHVTLAADLEFNETQEERIHAGVEFGQRSFYVLRGGVDDGRLSFGGTLYFDISGATEVALHYTLLADEAGEGETHIFSWLFQF